MDNLNNESNAEQTFPEEIARTGGTRLADVYAAGAATDGSNVTLLDKDGAAIDGETTLASTITESGSTTTVRARNPIKFDATTDTWDTSGAVKTFTFVPHYLLKEPTSLILKGDETKGIDSSDNTFEEYIWLLLVNAPGSDAESRTVEVYPMTASTCTSGYVSTEGAVDVLTVTYTQVF